jgi:MtrB/PioB family decaheme-associated outer membrane protein
MMAPAAYAADEAPAAGAPSGAVEVGVGTVSESSYKFGEYNGLYKKGPFGIGNFEVRGGQGSPDPLRWRIEGTDLGLDTRNITADFNNQGSFRVKYSYDELRRNYSDTYQSFYSGLGSNNLTIPAFASVPVASRGSSTANANSALSNWQNMQSPYATPQCAATGGTPAPGCAGPGYLLPGAMQNYNIETKRTNHRLDFTDQLMPGLEVFAAVRHENKDGNKLTGVAFGGPARGVMAVEPVSSTTDQFRAGLNWVGETAHASLTYLASVYQNDVNLWTVENPFNGALLNPFFNNAAHMQGAPDNQMQQINGTGGWVFTPGTKLTVTANYQKLTQDEQFISLPTNWSLPSTSANAKVINKSFTALFTSRVTKEFLVTANYKYEDRDNETPSRNWFVLGGDAAGSPNLFTNRPLDFKTNLFSIDGEYALGRRQAIKLGYEWKQVEREVNAVPPPPAELETPFQAEKTKEQTIRAEYRNALSTALTGRVTYAYSQRRASELEEEDVLLPVNPPAPMPAADPSLQGFRQFYLADRDRNKLRGVLNYQANDAWSFGSSLEYLKDEYKNLQYGLKNVRGYNINLDGAFAATEDLSFTAYYTYEDKKSEMDSLVIGRGNSTTILDAPAYTNPCSGYFAATGHLPSDLGTDPCRQWAESQADKVHTFGMGFKMRNLLAGHFLFSGDLAYSYAKTPISVSGGAYFGNGSTAAGQFNNVFIPAASFPDATSKWFALHLNGIYELDKVSAVRLQYTYSHLSTDDWQYDAYTNSALGVLAIQSFPGTGMTSPDYNVHVFGVSYIYRFF